MHNPIPQTKLLNLPVAFFAIAAVIVAFSLQMSWGLYPCSLCIAQRYVFLLLGLTAIFRQAAPARADNGLRILQGLIGLTGIGLAAKNVYVLLVPSSTCGRDTLSEFINSLPSAENWPAVFKATGMCSDPVPPVLGIPFPVWSLSLLILLTAVVLQRQTPTP